MKILSNAKKSHQASAMIMAIVLVAIAVATIVGYLGLVRAEYTSVARSQTWNGALILAEAGVEDALAMLNKYAGTANPLTNWANTAVSQDGWTSSSVTLNGNTYTLFHLSRTNAGFGHYEVYVTNIVDTVNYIFTPHILSIGTTDWKLTDSSVGVPATRRVFVKTTGDSSASGGLTSQYIMDFHGNQCTVDSYNSADPTASLWHANWFFNGANFGTYTNTLRTANVVVGTDGNLINASGVNIYGYVNTGPGGTVSINNGGTVGDLNWIGPDPTHPNHTGIQAGHKRDDMNIQFPVLSLPTPANTWFGSSWLSVPTPTNTFLMINGKTNYYVKVGGNWGYQIEGNFYSMIITNITGKPGTSTNKVYYQYSAALADSLFIDASNVVLSLPSGANMGSGDNLSVNTNANVEIYSGGNFSTGNGFINNLHQYAGAMSIIGLSGCTSIDFGGNAALTVNLYAPLASVDFNGGGSTTYDVCGSMKVANITVNGHYNFHFDEVLKVLSPPTRYLPSYWQEVY